MDKTKQSVRIIGHNLWPIKNKGPEISLRAACLLYLRLYDVLGLLTFRSISDFELNFLSFS